LGESKILNKTLFRLEAPTSGICVNPCSSVDKSGF